MAHFIAQCYFSNGYMQGSIAQHVRNISSERACMVYVKQHYLEAVGATWYNKSGCWAEFGNHMDHSSVHRTCSFQGTFLLVLSQTNF